MTFGRDPERFAGPLCGKNVSGSRSLIRGGRGEVYLQSRLLLIHFLPSSCVTNMGGLKRGHRISTTTVVMGETVRT